MIDKLSFPEPGYSDALMLDMMCLKEKIGISYFIWQITHLISIQLLYSI
jgi:hypothetical protein